MRFPALPALRLWSSMRSEPRSWCMDSLGMSLPVLLPAIIYLLRAGVGQNNRFHFGHLRGFSTACWLSHALEIQRIHHAIQRYGVPTSDRGSPTWRVN